MATEDTLRKRKSVRATFTKTVNSLIEEFEKEVPNGEIVKTKCLTLERIYSELKDCDDIILNNIGTDEDFAKEYDKIEEYREKLDLVRAKNENFVNKMYSDRKADSVISSPNEKRKMRLPKIELLHFGGDLKDYLGFWSQFQRIHTDEDLAPEDKFQYLLQCMVQGSRAREVIESFPPTSENYEKAIEALKNRFGREELLIEFYVRELLALVIQNATEKRGKSNISYLYDKLESHLRSLESIGLTSEKYEAILFPLVLDKENRNLFSLSKPLVESCIPRRIDASLAAKSNRAFSWK